MSDYSSTHILEGVQEEVSKEFVIQIKAMDSNVAAKRLKYLTIANKSDASFINIAQQFNSMVGHKTSVDD